eukprot:scaffold1323_cov160-Amphora_coffeaeformis.AAC.6
MTANPQETYRFREYDSDPTTNVGQDDDTAPTAAVFQAKLILLNDNKKNHHRTDEESSKNWIITDKTHVESKTIRYLKAPWTVSKELFLPIGYPRSVRHGYLEYQCYDSLQGLCSYLRGVLCSAQVLQAAGVGNAQATAWGAALTWALKDGMGMVGGLAFSYMASPLFDAHVKEFRLFADLINDVALTLDMLAPYCTNHILLVSSLSTLCKTLCGMSAAATKASITLHFALEGNMADLNAKESTQETLVSLMGMLCGVSLARWLSNYEKSHPEFTEQIQWMTFLILTGVHVWANWKGVCLLRLRSLNRERAEIVLSSLISAITTTTTTASSSRHDVPAKETSLHVPPPEDVNESLITSTRKMLFPGRLRLNSRLGDIIQDGPSPDYLAWFVQNQKYLVSENPRQGVVKVCLLRGATNADEVQAFCHALCLLQSPSTHTDDDDSWQETRALEYGKILDGWFQGPHRSLPDLLAQAGWDMEGRLYLGFSRRRTELVRKED